MLDDGRELQLAAIEVADDSRNALQSLVGGRPLRLHRLGAGSDRYGRLVAFAFAGEAQQSLQQAMLEQGRHGVSARIGDKACADALLTTNMQHGRPAAGSGPIPISPLCRPKSLPGYRPNGVILRWSKARSCRFAKAGPLYMPTSGGAGRGISPSPFSDAGSGPLPRPASNPRNLKAAASACADGSNSAAARSSMPKAPHRSNL